MRLSSNVLLPVCVHTETQSHAKTYKHTLKVTKVIKHNLFKFKNKEIEKFTEYTHL